MKKFKKNEPEIPEKRFKYKYWKNYTNYTYSIHDTKTGKWHNGNGFRQDGDVEYVMKRAIENIKYKEEMDNLNKFESDWLWSD